VRLRTEFYKIWAFAARSLLLNLRNVFAVFEMFFWPGVAIFSVGLLTRFLKLDPDTVSFILIGAVSMNTVQIGQLDISYSLLYDVWSKSLKHPFIAPVHLSHLILGAGLVGLLRGLIVFGVMGLLSMWLFDMDLSRPGFWGLLFFLSGIFLNALIIGMVVLTLVLRFGHRAEVAAWAFSYLILLLCGLYYPVTILPTGAQELALVIPLTYFLDYFRHFYGFPCLSPHPLLYGFSQCALYLAASYAMVNFALKGALKRGALLKLSE
jgi:ABC-2 type transport system permease protein